MAPGGRRARAREPARPRHGRARHARRHPALAARARARGARGRARARAARAHLRLAAAAARPRSARSTRSTAARLAARGVAPLGHTLMLIAGVASRYDDELWELVPDDPGPPAAAARATFVRSLGPAEQRARPRLRRRPPDRRARRRRAHRRGRVAGGARARAAPAAATLALVELEPDAPLPFDDGEFDLVLCAETIEHVRDVQLLLSEVTARAAPGRDARAHHAGEPRRSCAPPGPALAAPALLHAPLARARARRAGFEVALARAPRRVAARPRYVA